jgi:hypothetical protein
VTLHPPPSTSRTTGPQALAVGGVVLLVLIVVVGLTVDAFRGDEPAPTSDPAQGATQEAFASLEPGRDKEDALRAMLPAEPVESRTLSEYQLRVPETPAAECAYFETAVSPADDLYRLCFDGDRLVDKTTLLPEPDGVTGD